LAAIKGEEQIFKYELAKGAYEKMKRKMTVKIFACVMIMTSLTFGTACGKEAENVSAGNQIEASKIVSDDKEEVVLQSDAGATSEGAEESGKTASPSGTYARTYTEEFLGEEVSAEFYYTFNDDHTGEVSIQDVVPFTWDDNKIKFDDHDYEYVLEGDVLKVKETLDEWAEYVKK